MNLQSILEEAEKSFNELEFASCPIEEQEPFFWRWTDEGKERIKSFLTEQITKVVNSALEATKLQEPLVKDFIEGTPAWHNDMLTEYRDKPCFVCGMIPDNILKISEAVAEQAKKIEEFKK